MNPNIAIRFSFFVAQRIEHGAFVTLAEHLTPNRQTSKVAKVALQQEDKVALGWERLRCAD